ncbi:hypothetical protein EDB85DRAFT_1903119 [Lactarius pseudohatsudake]|nr:hypothetical protein EDB85DRAFT_1903119 [Lactarius pseudohatsudake]
MTHNNKKPSPNPTAAQGPARSPTASCERLGAADRVDWRETKGEGSGRAGKAFEACRSVAFRGCPGSDRAATTTRGGGETTRQETMRTETRTAWWLRDTKQAAASAEIWEREMLASLKGKAVDLALDNLVADLEAEGMALTPGALRAKEILDRYVAGKGILGVTPVSPPQIIKWQNEYVQAARKELEAEAHAQAEREWRTWRENELVKASGEAMRRLSIDYIIEKCGPDAEALIAEKQAFAKDYVHCNYQNWLNQVLSEHWPGNLPGGQTGSL